MKKFACAALLGLSLFVPAALAQGSGPAKAQSNKGQAAEKGSKQKAKEGTDCDANRAGVRCSRPKPRKPWFFGKA